MANGHRVLLPRFERIRRIKPRSSVQMITLVAEIA